MPRMKNSRSKDKGKKAGVSDEFTKFVREMGTKAPDAITLWREAKTPEEKALAKRKIIANAREKAQLRDQIAGFVRPLSLDNLRLAHKAVSDIHIGQTMLSILGDRYPNPKKSAQRKGK